MKRIFIVLALLCAIGAQGQAKSDLQKHYEAFYNAMRLQGDVQGVINALTHLNVLSPNKERRDTLAFIYANNNEHLQALNTIGIEKDPADSDLAVQVKAISLQALNQPKRALEQYEILYGRKKSPFLAYEMADLRIQTGENQKAMEYIEYGIQNSVDSMKYAFYERQQPYEVPLKAAFLHLKGLAQYNMDKANIDSAIATIDQALAMDPNFNLASLSRQALVSRKEKPEGAENE